MTPAETLTTARAVWREIHRDGSDDPRGLALWYAEFCNLDAALFMAEMGHEQSLENQHQRAFLALKGHSPLGLIGQLLGTFRPLAGLWASSHRPCHCTQLSCATI